VGLSTYVMPLGVLADSLTSIRDSQCLDSHLHCWKAYRSLGYYSQYPTKSAQRCGRMVSAVSRIGMCHTDTDSPPRQRP
jgi:hypothetical protein